MVVTWDAQGPSLRENIGRRLLIVLERVRVNEWDIVCVTELRADSSETLWVGEVDDEVPIVHSQKMAVVMRWEVLRVWRDKVQQKCNIEPVVAVVFGSLKIVSTYQVGSRRFQHECR